MRELLGPVAIGLALIASMVLSTVRLLYVVPPASVTAVAQGIRQEFRQGDLIVTVPPYIATTRLELGDLPLIEGRALTREDLIGVARVHLLELDSMFADDTAAQSLLALGHIVEEAHAPRVHRTTFELDAPERKLVDLGRDLDRARVEVRYADTEWQPCATKRDERWECPRHPDWNYVGREIKAIGNRPRTCVWLHPVPAGGALRVAIDLPPGVVVPRSAQLGFGFIDASVERVSAPVRLHLRADGQEVLAHTHEVMPGWVWRRVGLPVAARELSLEVDTDNNGAAHFCAALSVVEPGS